MLNINVFFLLEELIFVFCVQISSGVFMPNHILLFDTSHTFKIYIYYYTYS